MLSKLSLSSLPLLLGDAMSLFSKASDFTLVNNFTINHADKLSDGRSFISTCVPQGIWLDLYDIEFTHRVEW